MDWHHEYTLQEVSAATFTPQTTIKSWLHKGLMVGSDHTITGGGGRGRKRGFTFYSVMELATAAAILRGGPADLKSAFSAAREFATFDSPGRHMATPFPGSGLTLMLVSGNNCEIVKWEPGKDFFAAPRRNLGKPEAMTIIDLEQVFIRTCRGLGLDNAKVMKAAYSEAVKT